MVTLVFLIEYGSLVLFSVFFWIDKRGFYQFRKLSVHQNYTWTKTEKNKQARGKHYKTLRNQHKKIKVNSNGGAPEDSEPSNNVSVYSFLMLHMRESGVTLRVFLEIKSPT